MSRVAEGGRAAEEEKKRKPGKGNKGMGRTRGERRDVEMKTRRRRGYDLLRRMRVATVIYMCK